jgi:hypothetical protein
LTASENRMALTRQRVERRASHAKTAAYNAPRFPST